MSTGNKLNYLFPSPSIQYYVVSLFHPTRRFLVSFYDTTLLTAEAIPEFLKYLSCCGQLFISVNHQTHGKEFWVWDCQSSPHHIWASAPRCRCGLHTWMGRESRCSACSRDVLPTLMSSIGSPADCELQPELPEQVRPCHQCRPVWVKSLLTSLHLFSSNEVGFFQCVHFFFGFPVALGRKMHRLGVLLQLLWFMVSFKLTRFGLSISQTN